MTYVFQVSGDVVRRLREQLDAERPVAGQDWADLPAPAAAEPVQVEEQEVLVEVPARVCPATKSVPQHKDKQDGKGASVSSWISVVYLTHQPGSALVLVDDVTGREFRVAMTAIGLDYERKRRLAEENTSEIASETPDAESNIIT